MKKLQLLVFPLLFLQCRQAQEIRPSPIVNNVKTGEELKIILKENHRDGATWQLREDYDKKVIERLKEVWHGPDKGIYYHLRAVKEGTVSLHFVKRRYTDTLDLVTFVIAAAR
ncbi:MAG: hypothetical protein EBU33_02690 [Sphingobacteriia bacterium]|jgi:predicted secreted protein|nr:hypothetical protein [Sphingobacteriia bacterium]